MKIGLITLNGYLNIGNRLQNYAVQEILKERGYAVETILYSDNEEDANLFQHAKISLRNLFVKSGIYTSDFYLKCIKKSPRIKRFADFDKKYISQTKKYFFKTKRMAKYKNDFDYFCAGSDQIWNPCVVQNRSFFFMNFAESSHTFSFSASMGTTQVSQKYIDTFINGLMHIGHISVREDGAKRFIFEKTGRDSTVLLDPTLLLGKDRWMSVMTKPLFDVPRKYILTYFLGGTTSSQEKCISDYAHSNDAQIIDILGKDKDFIGPLEFVYLIANAEFIFTDSFHGAAFSVIFDKRFIVFQRNHSYDMSSRITTLLEKFAIQERFLNTNNNNLGDYFIELPEKTHNSSICSLDEILSKERKKTDCFLNNVFNQ